MNLKHSAPITETPRQFNEDAHDSRLSHVHNDLDLDLAHVPFVVTSYRPLLYEHDSSGQHPVNPWLPGKKQLVSHNLNARVDYMQERINMLAGTKVGSVRSELNQEQVHHVSCPETPTILQEPLLEQHALRTANFAIVCRRSADPQQHLSRPISQIVSPWRDRTRPEPFSRAHWPSSLAPRKTRLANSHRQSIRFTDRPFKTPGPTTPVKYTCLAVDADEIDTETCTATSAMSESGLCRESVALVPYMHASVPNLESLESQSAGSVHVDCGIRFEDCNSREIDSWQ